MSDTPGRRRRFPWEIHGYPEREFDEALDYAIAERVKARKSGNRAALKKAQETVRRVLNGHPDDIEALLERARTHKKPSGTRK